MCEKHGKELHDVAIGGVLHIDKVKVQNFQCFQNNVRRMENWWQQN